MDQKSLQMFAVFVSVMRKKRELKKGLTFSCAFSRETSAWVEILKQKRGGKKSIAFKK